ncbi:hypothetical protein ACHWQZ_G012128 [Mnemiopsis leidyi]
MTVSAENSCSFDVDAVDSDYAFKCLPKQKILENILVGLAVLMVIVLLSALVYAKRPPPTPSQEEETANRSYFSRVRTTVSMWRD